MRPQPPSQDREGLGPRSIQALLKRIRKRFGRLEGVVDQVESLIGKKHSTTGGLVGKIQKTRNKAAHANTEGRHQEIDDTTVRALLDDIAMVLLNLSNIAYAIENARGGGPDA